MLLVALLLRRKRPLLFSRSYWLHLSCQNNNSPSRDERMRVARVQRYLESIPTLAGAVVVWSVCVRNVKTHVHSVGRGISFYPRSRMSFNCPLCEVVLETRADLDEHVKEEHTTYYYDTYLLVPMVLNDIATVGTTTTVLTSPPTVTVRFACLPRSMLTLSSLLAWLGWFQFDVLLCLLFAGRW